MFRHDLLRKHEKHLLLHEYDYDNNGFLAQVNAIADHLDDLLLLTEGERLKVYYDILDWIKGYLKRVTAVYTGTVEITEDHNSGWVVQLPISNEPGYEALENLDSPSITSNEPVQMQYVVGANNLEVSYNNVLLVKNENYEEVNTKGADNRTELSNKIKLLFPVKKGDKLFFKTENNIKTVINGTLNTQEVYNELVSIVNSQLDRINNLLGISNQMLGLACNEITWTVSNNINPGNIITIPNNVTYIVGRYHLRLSYDGLILDRTRFEEVGEVNSLSNKFKLLCALPAGTTFTAWIIHINGNEDLTNEAQTAEIRNLAYRVSALEQSINN